MTHSNHEVHAKSVLVVEDDPDLCVLIRRIVEESFESLNVQFASSVHEAANWIRHNDPVDLVLADYLLADSDSGYELRDLCQKWMPKTTFAMMSSMPLELPNVAAGSFLKKPFSLGECREFLKVHLAH